MGCCSTSPEFTISNPDLYISDAIFKIQNRKNVEVLSNFDRSAPDRIIIQIENVQTNALGLSIYISNAGLMKYLHKTCSANFSLLEEQLQFQGVELMELMIQFFNKEIIDYYIPIYLEQEGPRMSFEAEPTLEFASYCTPILKKKIHPMRYAAEHANIPFLKHLVEYYKKNSPPDCFDVHSIDPETGENCALISCKIGSISLVEYLHKIGCNFKISNKNNENAINLAVVLKMPRKNEPNISVLPYLVEVIKLDIAENYEETLMLCRSKEIVEYIEEKLRDRGVYVTKKVVESKYQQSFSLVNICTESPCKISSVPSLLSSIEHRELSLISS